MNSRLPADSQEPGAGRPRIPPADPSNPRRRIAHVTFGLEIGGAEKLLRVFADHTGDDAEVSFVCLGDDGPIGDELRRAGYRVRILRRPGGIRPALWWELGQIFRRQRIDIVHTHDIRPMIYAAPAAAAVGVPIRVHTQHGRSIGDNRRQQRLAATASRFVTDAVGVSADVTTVATAARWRPGRFHTIRNGIDAGPRAATRESLRRRLLCVARLSPEKGVDVLIEAMSILAGDDNRWHLTLAGDGVCREDLESQIRRLRLGDCVSMVGSVDDVARRMQAADVYVLPSRSEGVSLTLLEAMFAGVPIVATAVGGTPEVITDPSIGRLVPPDDPPALAAAIVQTAEDDRLAEQIRAARQLAQNQFSAASMMQHYRAIYSGASR